MDEKCGATSSDPQVLVIDLKAHERGDLEVALKDGVPAVAYSCDSLKLLRGCSLDGSYGFIGVTRKEETVQLVSSDEIKVNLPGSGLGIVAQLGGEIEKGTALDLATVLVGKSRTTVRKAAAAQLKGPCAGATHFVHGAYLGAFAMTTGTRGKTRVAAELFGGATASTQSAKTVTNKDGSLEACRTSSSTATAPPAECGAILRLELIPFSASAPPKPPEGPQAEASTCPQGMVLTAGKCTRSAEAPYLCAANDAKDCDAQCQKGNLGSCYNLAILAARGEGVPKDIARSAQLYTKACDAGHTKACFVLGAIYATGQGVPKDVPRGVELFRKACDDGEMKSCLNLGYMYEDGQGIAKDEARAATLYARSCDAGDPAGCTNLATMYKEGRGVAADPKKAADLMKRAEQGR